MLEKLWIIFGMASFLSPVESVETVMIETGQRGLVNIAESYMYRPNLRTEQGKDELHTMRNYRKKMREELKNSLLEQITFTDGGEILPGQKICLPLMSQSTLNKIKIQGLPEGIATHPSLNPNLFVVRTVRSIIRGDFARKLKEDETKTKIPDPDRHWSVNYSHENNTFIDLKDDFDLDDNSFTIVALIRLRAKSGEPIRGARILSKRSNNNEGWEFVVPSYYGQTISFYANAIPGHIDYGKSSLPEDTWTAVGIVFDRHTYADEVALITPYIDGFPDGRGTYLQVNGNLSSSAPLTVGHWRDESGLLGHGRRDYRLPGYPRFNPHFQGDIRDIYIWRQALSKKQMRKHSRELLKRMGRRPSPCPWGYMELDCRCYQVFNKLKTFSMSEQFCQEQGGTLAMPRTERIQDFLEVLMQQSDKLSFWIGLDDRQTERRKYWADGRELLYNKRKGKKEFNRFPNGKPDKQYHTEDCVEELKTRPDFVWNDENCIKLNAFICEVSNPKAHCIASDQSARI